MHLVEINAEQCKVGEVGAKGCQYILGGRGVEVVERRHEGGTMGSEVGREGGQCLVASWQCRELQRGGCFGWEGIEQWVDSEEISSIGHRIVCFGGCLI